ncbi:Flp family type IVb pilin [Bdellovibrio sp. HCB274]|uniref:Flp family type IVb pilin n=1 Tax=Bdellovibrio sp. HCB274 TaxID=3394361 RepID=UPI0039B535A4
MTNSKKLIKNNKGQGLIEYLIIVAIVAVGSIAVIKLVGANIDVQFANVAKALGGESGKIAAKEVTDGVYKKRDFGNFFEDAVNDKSSKGK